MDAPPVALVSLLTTDRRLIYRPVHHLTSICQSGVWSGGGKISNAGCSWYSSPVAMNHFIGGRSGGTIYYKPVQCPANYVMAGTRMYGIGDGVDEEHVDAYCCPFS